jgi:hypothetical protein
VLYRGLTDVYDKNHAKRNKQFDILWTVHRDILRNEDQQDDYRNKFKEKKVNLVGPY